MPRYTKQRDKYNCGPVAILNALRWCGINIPYEPGLRHLERLCVSLPPDKGCRHSNFDRALRMMGKDVFEVRRVYRPSPRQIKAHLEIGGAVIYNYGWWEGDNFGRHFVFIVSGTKRAPFGAVNIGTRGKALRNLGLARFRREAYQFVEDRTRKAWFLTKLS